MSDDMGRELAYLSSHATNRYFIPNWGRLYIILQARFYRDPFLSLWPLTSPSQKPGLSCCEKQVTPGHSFYSWIRFVISPSNVDALW